MVVTAACSYYPSMVLLLNAKYAKVERERRFLISESLPTTQSTVSRIDDLYVIGTRLRLRRIEGVGNGSSDVVFKLAQKIPASDGANGEQGLITNTYLNKDEYDLLSQLPSRALTKTRYGFPPLSIDVFDGVLAGLVIAEVEFADNQTMEAFSPPPYCGVEVSSNRRFTGGNFATFASVSETKALLSSVLG